jgi:hypothetical protein
MLRIINAADTGLANSPVFGDRFSATAEAGVMNRTNLGATKPHVGSSSGFQLLKKLIDGRSPARGGTGICSPATELVRLNAEREAGVFAGLGASGSAHTIGTPGSSRESGFMRV